jgi:hypothetical protein
LVYAGLTINGPATVAPGSSAAFTAVGRFSNGSTQDATAQVTWRSSNTAVLSIAPNGLATAGAAGEAQLQATVLAATATVTVMVLPTGTFRLTGVVSESGLAVGGATVAVTAGQGTGLSTTTDAAGAFRLYGVAGDVQIQVSKNGYSPASRTLMVGSNSLADFSIAPIVPEATIAGTYSMTIAADPACPAAGSSNTALPDEVRQRQYLATITQTGPSFDVILSGANFLVTQGHGNAFSGRVEPNAITAILWSGYDAYYKSYDYQPAVTEVLDGGQVFVAYGTATMSPRGQALVGTIDGDLAVGRWMGYTGGAWTADCSGHHPITLTLQSSSPSRRRR